MARIKKDQKLSSSKGKALEPAKKNMAAQKIARKSAPVTSGVKQVTKRRIRPGKAALR